MFFIALIALASWSDAVVFQAPLTRIEPPMIKMLREGTWAEYLRRLEKSQPVQSTSDVETAIYPHKVNGFADVSYIANITIGNPDQMFKVILDTGSSRLWVPDMTCGRKKEQGCERSECDRGAICEIMCPKKECCLAKNELLRGINGCKGKRLFNSKNSTTYRRLRKSWQIHYGTGYAAGFTGKDTIRFGDSGDRLAVGGVEFGQASNLDDSFQQKSFDGILGLAYDNYDKGNIVPAIHRAARYRQLEQPVFTVFYKSVGSQRNVYGGVFTYGAVDAKNCGRILAYHNLTSSHYWQFPMQAISIGNYKSEIGWQAISDTGSSAIIGPPDIILKIAKEVGANYMPIYKTFLIDCDKKPKLEITIGGRKYVIESENLIINAGGDMCIFPITPMVLPGGPEWILGDPFIRQYCNIYDLGRKRIGFAEVRKS
ncbi:hypothetical protein Aduo_007306 [Ancylostoma duodenale]